MTIKIAVQCLDKRTKQTGTFGYRQDRDMYSVTPIFPDLVALFKYMKINNIVEDKGGN